MTAWSEAAVCRSEDPDLFHPDGSTGPWLQVIEQAKAVCRRCPVVDACLQFALDENIPAGIFGGLTDAERASLTRSVRRGRTVPGEVQQKAATARQPRRERTMATIFEDHTVRLFGGHLGWAGSDQIYVDGGKYTPRQIAFIVGRGRTPEGPVLLECASSDCVLPEHLADQRDRGYCGTRTGYQRHIDSGEEICGPCRKANSNAEARRAKKLAAA